MCGQKARAGGQTALCKGHDRSNVDSMVTVFANAPIQPTYVAIQVGKIYFDAPCKKCRDGRSPTTNIRPVDHIGRPTGDMNVCASHATLATNGLTIEFA
jgi:hypothetical protein